MLTPACQPYCYLFVIIIKAKWSCKTCNKQTDQLVCLLPILQDHLALMMETLGKMPRKIASSGTRSKDYFDDGMFSSQVTLLS